MVNTHKTDLAVKFGITCNKENMRLPRFFWFPKLHKLPFKARFIAGARICSMKQLSLLLNDALSCVKEAFHKYCLNIKEKSGFNYWWSINASREAKRKLKTLVVHDIQVFDFSTLYTCLSLDMVKTDIFRVLDLVFSKSKTYICINYCNRFFACKKYRGYNCLDIKYMKEALVYILDNTFVTFGNLVFRQTKGIPMGGNCSPLIADLFLSMREFSFMQNLVANRRFKLAGLLSHTSRYIDDICVVNYKYFHKLLSCIYPSELLAERCGIDDKRVQYLDLDISVIDDRVCFSVFHKVDLFPFDVVMYTFPSSNIPYALGISVFAAQMLRFVRICSDIVCLKKRSELVINKFIERGYLKHDMIRGAERLLNVHRCDLTVFSWISAKQWTAAIT